MTPHTRWVSVLALALVVGPVAWAGPRCQIVPVADARLRLDLWGRELAAAKGPVMAHSARRIRSGWMQR